MSSGGPQGSHHVGGRARGGDADDCVKVVHPMFLQLLPAAVHVVLGILHGVAQSGVATGNESDDQCGGHAEGGGNLRSIEYSEAPAGTGPQVEDASALFHAGDDLGDEFLDLGYGLLYGQCHLLVLGVDILQDFPHRFLFEVVVQRGLLGNLDECHGVVVYRLE